MTEDNEKPETSANVVSGVIRDEKGRVVHGSKGPNPTGLNGHTKGYQPYGIRSRYWLENFTAEEIEEIVNDKAKYGKLSSYDAMVIKHVARALGIDVDANSSERESLLSRIEGQPKATVDINHGGKVQFDGQIIIQPVTTRKDQKDGQ